ncbi:50S ribosomal protein L18, partial [Wolbachia endosymbiont of Pentidionis agamae]|uniref:50S ribosomal protein L18 n=1 Tax=Wolbachia endosymbiont of Pentidionis agamae TaxID=3110435 RepID=UPI002FD49989
LIDDSNELTHASASTLDLEVKKECNRRVNAESVKVVSLLMIKRLLNININEQLVFDRGSNRYTGLVSQFADAIRVAGFKI